MNTTQKGWTDKREDYLRKAYASVRAEENPVPLNKAVDNWDVFTGEASRHYFWKALGLFRLNDSLELTDASGDHLIELDTDISMNDLDQDVELVPGDPEKVRREEREEYRSFGELDVPQVPLFIAWEHFDRHGYEVFPYEDPDLRGLAARDESRNGEKWLGFYSHDGRNESSSWINQVFRGLEIEGDGFLSTEDVFSDRNRQNYTDTIWENEPLKIRQRLDSVWDAAREVVEDELPERVQRYEERWKDSITEKEALKREMRLLVGDDEFVDDGAYIERITDSYWNGEIERASPVLEPFLENIEASPRDEGDMPYGEAVRDSDTSRGKKERNKVYMEHFLDLVWQMSEQAYE